MEYGCPWPAEWQLVSHGGIEFAIGVENRSMWSPSRYSLFVYARQPDSTNWYIQLVVPDIIGGGPIRMQLDSETGLMEFHQAIGAKKDGGLREYLIATYDTGSAAPSSH